LRKFFDFHSERSRRTDAGISGVGARNFDTGWMVGVRYPANWLSKPVNGS
jgi:hypothetical protein